MNAFRRFLRNRRERASGTQLWLIPVCWIIGHDDGTNGRTCWCRRCGITTWTDSDTPDW